ncbi:hypothetical protein HQ487_05080 [Candidatus Uhrbacteria bacterium]|nr:hypothetical protein [Candidatus Uhrbacteria bacterium]
MFFLKRQLNKAKRRITPSTVFRTRLLSELSVAYDQTYGCPRPKSLTYRFAMVGLASFVLIFTMGTGVYAYESPEVTNGHPLYFVKNGMETLQQGFHRSPESRAEFHANMMRRRLQEGEHFLPNHPNSVPFSLDAAADQFEHTIQALEDGVIDQEAREGVIESLSMQRARYLELSSRVLDSEEESGELEPLRKRIEGHQLSEEEFTRLFEKSRRANDSLNGQ